MSELLCIKFVSIGVVFAFKTSKLKNNNLKTCGISSSVYFHAENTLFFPLKPFLCDGLSWLSYMCFPLPYFPKIQITLNHFLVDDVL